METVTTIRGDDRAPSLGNVVAVEGAAINVNVRLAAVLGVDSAALSGIVTHEAGFPDGDAQCTGAVTYARIAFNLNGAALVGGSGVVGIIALEERSGAIPVGNGEFPFVADQDSATCVGMAADKGAAFDGQLFHRDVLSGKDGSAPAAGGITAVEGAVFNNQVAGGFGIDGTAVTPGMVAGNGAVFQGAVCLVDHIQRSAATFSITASGIVAVAGFAAAKDAVIKIGTGIFRIVIYSTAAVGFVALEYGVPYADVPFAAGASRLRPDGAATVFGGVGRHLVVQEIGFEDAIV